MVQRQRKLHLQINSWVAKAIKHESEHSNDRLWKNGPTAEEAEQQHQQRIRFLRKHVRHNHEAAAVAERLEKCNSYRHCLSGACPICSRLFQRWFVRATKPFIRDYLDIENRQLLAISLVPTSRKIKPGRLLEFSINDLHRRLKYALNRSNVGIAIGGIDLSFNEDQEGEYKPFWNGHLYAITSGEKDDICAKLKGVTGRSIAIPRPKKVTRFENTARRRSYAMKMHFDRRVGYTEFKIRNGRRRKCRNTKGDRLLAAQRLELLLFLDQVGFVTRVFFRGAKPVPKSSGVMIRAIDGFGHDI
jgi:hypothetical protein